MADKKIIAVVGATGAQGGALVRAILADPGGPFAARALTRGTSAQVLEWNIDDPSQAEGSRDAALHAYAAVRDTLRARIERDIIP